MPACSNSYGKYGTVNDESFEHYSMFVLIKIIIIAQNGSVCVGLRVYVRAYVLTIEMTFSPLSHSSHFSIHQNLKNKRIPP